jgi:predicted nucleic acid binding AN1-type Zn finger protein
MKNLILILCLLSLPAAAGTPGNIGGGNDVLPQIIKRPNSGGCTNLCLPPTKPTGGK